MVGQHQLAIAAYGNVFDYPFWPTRVEYQSQVCLGVGRLKVRNSRSIIAIVFER